MLFFYLVHLLPVSIRATIVKVSQIDYYTPWISTIGGGSYSKKLSELFLVDSDRTRRDKQAYIGHSSGWAKFLELGVFEF